MPSPLTAPQAAPTPSARRSPPLRGGRARAVRKGRVRFRSRPAVSEQAREGFGLEIFLKKPCEKSKNQPYSPVKNYEENLIP
ncbi:unnamed protein product [Coccothraustes coccothraustes]